MIPLSIFHRAHKAPTPTPRDQQESNTLFYTQRDENKQQRGKVEKIIIRLILNLRSDQGFFSFSVGKSCYN